MKALRVLVLATVALAPRAWAGDEEAEPASDAEAKRRAAALLDEGNRSFSQKSYADALERYEQAHAAFPSYKILFNLAEAHRELGHYGLAVDCYERFLEKGGAAKGSAARIAAESSLEDLRGKVGYLVVESELAGVAVDIDGKRRGSTPLAAIAVDPGAHTVEAEVPGTGKVSKRIEIAAGQRTRFPVGAQAADPNFVGPAEPLPELVSPLAPPGPALVADASAADRDDGGVLGKWWLWAAIGAVALTATGVAIAAGTGGTDFVPRGELGSSGTSEWERF